MKKEFVIGAVLLGATLISWLVLPPIFTADGRNAQDAAAQAMDAQRQLAGFSPSLAHRVDDQTLEQLKEADLQRLVDAAAEMADKAAQSKPAAQPDGAEKNAPAAEPPVSPFTAMVQQQQKEADAARSSDQRLQLEPGKYSTVSATGTGLKQAVDQVIALRKENSSRLADAVKKAKEADAAGTNALGIAQIYGNAQFVQAANLFIQAVQQRTELGRLHGQLVEQTARFRAAAAEVEYYTTLKNDEISKGLAADLEDLKTKQTDASAKADAIDAAVAQREQELAKARADLAKAREDVAAIESKSFKAGDDAAFDAFRKSYAEASDRMRKLQIQEQELSSGGRKDAALDDDDLESGAIAGGKTMDGLEELKRKQAIARIRAERSTAGVKALETAVKNSQDAIANAAKMLSDAQKREQAVKTDLDATLKAIDTAASTAWATEQSALDLATAAEKSFKASEAEGTRVSREASEKQSEVDQNRTNERLTAIANDQLAATVGVSAAAETKMLIGRIQAGRFFSLQRQLAVLSDYAKAANNSAFKASDLEQSVTDSRQAATTAINEAVAKFNDIAKRNAATGWTATASAAAGYHLLIYTDATQADRHKTEAIDALKRALDKRDRHPSTKAQVLLRAQLTGEAPPEPGQSLTPSAAPTEGEGEKKSGDTEGTPPTPPV